MKLEGTLDKYCLLEVFQLLELGSRTGCLIINIEADKGMVFFRDGLIVFARLKQLEALSELLLRLGKVSKEKLDEIEKRKKDKNKFSLAAELIASEIISEIELERILKQQIEKVILEILNWEEGKFKFVEGHLNTSERTPTLKIRELLSKVRQLQNDNNLPVLAGETVLSRLHQGDNITSEELNDEKKLQLLNPILGHFVEHLIRELNSFLSSRIYLELISLKLAWYSEFIELVHSAELKLYLFNLLPAEIPCLIAISHNSLRALLEYSLGGEGLLPKDNLPFSEVEKCLAERLIYKIKN